MPTSDFDELGHRRNRDGSGAPHHRMRVRRRPHRHQSLPHRVHRKSPRGPCLGDHRVFIRAMPGFFAGWPDRRIGFGIPLTNVVPHPNEPALTAFWFPLVGLAGVHQACATDRERLRTRLGNLSDLHPLAITGTQVHLGRTQQSIDPKGSRICGGAIGGGESFQDIPQRRGDGRTRKYPTGAVPAEPDRVRSSADRIDGNGNLTRTISCAPRLLGRPRPAVNS